MSQNNPGSTQKQLQTSGIKFKKVVLEDYTVRKTRKQKCELKFSFTPLVSLC